MHNQKQFCCYMKRRNPSKNGILTGYKNTLIPLPLQAPFEQGGVFSMCWDIMLLIRSSPEKPLNAP